MFLVLQTNNISINENFDGKINFHLPQHSFDANSDLQFRITHLYIAFDRMIFTKPISATSLLSLQSNLIDKSSFNPHQDLIFLPASDLSTSVHYTPTQFLKYKLRLRDLNDAEFVLHSESKDLIRRISFVSLQLEILPYGWL